MKQKKGPDILVIMLIVLAILVVWAIVQTIGSYHYRAALLQEIRERQRVEQLNKETTEEVVLEEPEVSEEPEVIEEPEPEQPEVLVQTVYQKTSSYLTDDVPADEDVQYCINTWCETYGVPYTLALAVIQTESSFRADAVNSANTCFGYMQINICNEEYLKKTLGIKTIKDPFDNLQAGIYMLSRYIDKYDDLEMALVAYNCGDGGAQKNHFSKGEYSTGYSRKVMERKADWDALIG